MVKIRNVEIYRLAAFLLLFAMLAMCISIRGSPYPVDIDVDSEEPKRGNYMDYDIYVETMENLKVIVNVAYYIPGYGWSGWKEIWRGYILTTKKVFYRTLYIPEDAETGSVVIWVQIQYGSDDFYGFKKGEHYYLDQELVHIAGHISAPSVPKADYWRDQANYWKQKYKNLTAMYDDLMAKYNTLQKEYNTLSEKYRSLELKYHKLFDNYTKLQEEYNDLLIKHSELKNDYIRLEQERNYIYIALIVLIALALILGGYIYHLRKRLKFSVSSRSEKIMER